MFNTATGIHKFAASGYEIDDDMKRAQTTVPGRIAAAIASVATTLALLAAVVSLSEPQRSQLIAATASRQAVTPKNVLLVAQSKQAQPTPVAEVTAR